jgi:hypothetical protein
MGKKKWIKEKAKHPSGAHPNSDFSNGEQIKRNDLLEIADSSNPTTLKKFQKKKKAEEGKIPLHERLYGKEI